MSKKMQREKKNAKRSNQIFREYKGKIQEKFTSENLWDKKTLPQEWWKLHS